MNRWYLNCALVLLAAFAGASGLFATSGCNQQDEKELRQELSALKAELRDLKQLRYEVRTLENDVQSIRGRLSKETPQEEDKRPIVPQRFEPDGSHLDDPFLGPRDAKTIVMAFGNFQCRPCRTFFDETFPQLKSEFADSDRVKVIFRDFPLRTNPQAMKASTLAHCAGEQGAYWKMFDLLFQERERVDAGEFEALAQLLDNVDTDRLKQCAGSARYERELQKDIAEAVRLGARGAPGFFVGRQEEQGDAYQGVFIRGAQPYAVIRAQIEKFL